MAENNGWWVPGSGEDIGGCKSIEMTCQIQNYFHVKPTMEYYYKKGIFVHSKKVRKRMNCVWGRGRGWGKG
jgi:hypothetical protein